MIHTAWASLSFLAVSAAAQSPEEAWKPASPEKLYDVVEVVDGDTLYIQRNDEVEKLRLLSVDTEEKITGRPNTSPTKPETIFGEETKNWAKAFFEELRDGEAPPRVGLLFPGGEEIRDVYGRLLCHVILPDGTDFNLLLVRTGKSPYFNKYGNSRICHEAFVAAQARARERRLGVWNPGTNRPEQADAPSARRPYDRLIPWWQARAEAIEGFRRGSAEDPLGMVSAEDAQGLGRSLAWCAEKEGRTVEVFGTIGRLFDEKSGDLTVLFRTPSRDEAFRAIVPAEARTALASLDLGGRTREFRQNYLYVRGCIVRGPRGYRMLAGRVEQWRLGGPEPSGE